MQFFESIFERMRNFLGNDGNDELLFFVLVFLLLFISSYGRNCEDFNEGFDSGYLLFFVILIIFLLISNSVENQQNEEFIP